MKKHVSTPDDTSLAFIKYFLFQALANTASRQYNRFVSRTQHVGRYYWERSSAGEHCIDIAGVAGSIPAVPTIALDDQNRQTARSVRVENGTMKIRNSSKSLQKRHRDNRVVRRRGRLYVINKTNPRFKARQG